MGNAKNAGDVDITRSKVYTNEIGKYKNKSMEVENGDEAPDAVAAKSLNISIGGLGNIEGLKDIFKITEMDVVTGKSLDVLV